MSENDAVEIFNARGVCMFNKRNFLQCLCSVALVGGLTLPCAAQPKKGPPNPPANPGAGNPTPPGVGIPPRRNNNRPSASAIQQARINDGFERVLATRAM